MPPPLGRHVSDVANSGDGSSARPLFWDHGDVLYGLYGKRDFFGAIMGRLWDLYGFVWICMDLYGFIWIYDLWEYEKAILMEV